MPNSNEKIPYQEPKDITLEFLSRTHSSFLDYLLENSKKLENMSIKIPLSSVPDIVYVRQWFNICSSNFKAWIQCTTAEKEANPKLFEIKGVAWEDTEIVP